MQYTTLISYIPANLNRYQWEVTSTEARRILSMFVKGNACRKEDIFQGEESPDWLADNIRVDSICHAKDINPNNIIIVGMDDSTEKHKICSIYIGERHYE